MQLYKLALALVLCLTIFGMPPSLSAATGKKSIRASKKTAHVSKPTPGVSAREYLRSIRKLLVSLENDFPNRYLRPPDSHGRFDMLPGVNWPAIPSEQRDELEREALSKWIANVAKPFFSFTTTKAFKRNQILNSYAKKLASIVPRSAETESLHLRLTNVLEEAIQFNRIFVGVSFFELNESVTVTEWLEWWEKNFGTFSPYSRFCCPFSGFALDEIKADLEQLRIKYNILQSEIQ